MAKHVLTLIPGNGIGKEVTDGSATSDIDGNDTTTTFTEKVINFL